MDAPQIYPPQPPAAQPQYAGGAHFDDNAFSFNPPHAQADQGHAPPMPMQDGNPFGHPGAYGAPTASQPQAIPPQVQAQQFFGGYPAQQQQQEFPSYPNDPFAASYAGQQAPVTTPPPNTPQSPPQFYGAAFPVAAAAPQATSPQQQPQYPGMQPGAMRMASNGPVRSPPAQPARQMNQAEKHTGKMFKDLVNLSIKNPGPASPEQQGGGVTPMAYRQPQPEVPANTPVGGYQQGPDFSSQFQVINNNLFGAMPTPRPMGQQEQQQQQPDAFDAALKGRM